MTHPKLLGFLAQQMLIPGEVSRKILDAIKNDDVIDSTELLKYSISNNEIKKLGDLYQQKLKQIPFKQGQPRYLHFYYMLKDKFPQISWEIKNEGNAKPIVNFLLPLIDHLQPSILSLLLDRAGIFSNKLRLRYQYKCLNQTQDHIVEIIDDFMNKTQVIYPNELQMERIIHWIEQARSGLETTIFIHTCPDYAAEPTGDAMQPYRHTFQSLGGGIGQIAKRIVNILPDLKELLIKLDIQPKIVTTIADYEAFSEDTLKKVHVTKDEFLHKVNLSCQEFDKACHNVLPIKTLMFTELCGGEHAWLKKTEEIKEYFKINNFGLTQLNHDSFLHIAKYRKALYKNWFGDKGSISAYVPIAINQAAEYATIGFYITERFQNCLVLGADSDYFGSFYSFYKVVPTLYFKRFYC